MTYISRPKGSEALSRPVQSEDELREPLEKVINGLGLTLLDLSVSHRKGSVQVRLTVYRGAEPVSINDCSMVHRAVLPRLELAFRGGDSSRPEVKSEMRTGRRTPALSKKQEGRGGRKDRPQIQETGPDLYVEVSSPGIDRPIKEGREFAHFAGRYVKCYRTDISDWTGGVLLSSDKEGVILKTENGETRLAYEIIAKAKLGRSAGESRPAEKSGDADSSRA